MANPFLIHFSILAAGCSLVFGKELPSDVKALGTQQAAAALKIDRSYIQELEKLKVKYTKQGDLDTANAIVALIEKTEAKIIRDALNAGKWNYVDADGKTLAVRSFDGDVLLPGTGARCPYKIANGIIRIDWGNGAFEELKIDPSNLRLFKGVNHYGHTFKYVLVD